MSKQHKVAERNVVIEDDVWIGANAVILPNVKIGRGSVVGAGAVVSRDIPPYSIYTGMPERRVRPRFSGTEIAEHEYALNKLK